jgi:hypothetical protein
MDPLFGSIIMLQSNKQQGMNPEFNQKMEIDA